MTSALSMFAIRNLRTETVLAGRAELASGVRKRLVGLLSRSSLREGEALILPRCSSIHTWFMRFPLDVVFVKSVQGSRVKGQGSCLEPSTLNLEQPMHGVVVKVAEGLKPFRFARAREADTVIELPAGAISRTYTHTGELLEIAEDSVDPRKKI